MWLVCKFPCAFNRYSKAVFATALVFFAMGAAFFLIGFTYWLVAFYWFQKFQASIRHHM